MFVERLWRSVKYKSIYLHAYETPREVNVAHRRVGGHRRLGLRRPHPRGAALCAADRAAVSPGRGTGLSLAVQKSRKPPDARRAISFLPPRFPAHIPLVDDDPLVNQLILDTLIGEGYQLDGVAAPQRRSLLGSMIGDNWQAHVQGTRAIGTPAVRVREKPADAIMQSDTLHEIAWFVESV